MRLQYALHVVLPVGAFLPLLRRAAPEVRDGQQAQLVVTRASSEAAAAPRKRPNRAGQRWAGAHASSRPLRPPLAWARPHAQALGVLERRVREALEGRPEVLEAYLFGSVARGEGAPHSDVDVAVYIDRAAAPEARFGLQAELATELMSALHRNDIDVVLLNDATPLLYHRVLRDGVRLFARDLARTTTREGAAISRYCDWSPQEARMDAVLRERIRDGEFGR